VSSVHNRQFFCQPATLVAPRLLGSTLVRVVNGVRLSGLIIETEAYQGIQDLGCHAHVGLTHRNAPLFEAPGRAYVYFTYGMHWMMNAVCDSEGTPAAVLIRAIVPLEGLDVMCQNRPTLAEKPTWLNGPAKLTQALGIDRSHNRVDLCDPSSPVRIEPGIEIPAELVHVTARIGLGKTPEPWYSMPWRWVVRYSDTQNLLQARQSVPQQSLDTL
jgi:DNA-3-methyladenine glycosylase